MKITIDETAGFCWGVVRTIDTVEEILKNNTEKDVYILGEIIHNPPEIHRLEAKGLKTIVHEDLDRIGPENSVVIIRAHGEPPKTYAEAGRLGLNLVDATCPLVKNLHAKVREYYESGYQIVIFGKKEHAEVIGIRGVCNDECIVIKNAEEAISQLDFSRRAVLVSQTTMDRATFASIAAEIEEHFIQSGPGGKELFTAKDTICKFVSGREDRLAEFVKSNTVIVFVAGKKSSNGKSLFNFCHSINPRTYFIESPEELEAEWFSGAESAGITGATSTPQWYLARIKEELEEMVGNE